MQRVREKWCENNENGKIVPTTGNIMLTMKTNHSRMKQMIASKMTEKKWVRDRCYTDRNIKREEEWKKHNHVSKINTSMAED